VFAAEGSFKTGAVIEGGVDFKALVLQKALQEGDKPLVVIHDEHALHDFHSARNRLTLL
jgi:hypothetical protein